jgi:hypothetical protein
VVAANETYTIKTTLVAKLLDETREELYSVRNAAAAQERHLTEEVFFINM